MNNLKILKQKGFELTGEIELYSDYDGYGCCIEIKCTEDLLNCFKNDENFDLIDKNGLFYIDFFIRNEDCEEEDFCIIYDEDRTIEYSIADEEFCIFKEALEEYSISKTGKRLQQLFEEYEPKYEE